MRLVHLHGFPVLLGIFYFNKIIMPCTMDHNAHHACANHTYHVKLCAHEQLQLH